MLILKWKALRFIKDLVAEGGTNMMPPVYEAILENTDFPMKHQIVLVTDGNIGFEEEMMAIVHEHIGKKRLHVVGYWVSTKLLSCKKFS